MALGVLPFYTEEDVFFFRYDLDVLTKELVVVLPVPRLLGVYLFLGLDHGVVKPELPLALDVNLWLLYRFIARPPGVFKSTRSKGATHVYVCG